MGTVATETHTLPGTTFSNPTERGSYDSQAEAAMTLREYERHLIDFFTTTYHRRTHGGIGMPPIKKWEAGILDGDGDVPPAGLPDLPADPDRLRLDFMPYEERTVQPYGVLWDHVHYWHEVLSPWINAPDPADAGREKPRKRQFTCRRDPTDISRIWFLDPASDKYRPIPYRQTGRPAVTVWEVRAVVRDLQRANKPVTEDGIFADVERRRLNVDEAVAKTRSARRDRQRRAHLSPDAKPAQVEAQPKAGVKTRADEFDPALFERPIRPFDIAE